MNANAKNKVIAALQMPKRRSQTQSSPAKTGELTHLCLMYFGSAIARSEEISHKFIDFRQPEERDHQFVKYNGGQINAEVNSMHTRALGYCTGCYVEISKY